MLGHFTPPGPVGANFMASTAPVKFIMGPVGSGKTSCMVMDTVQTAARQPRSKIDGVRYSKALFVRETFRQLEGTTLPSWWAWMPKSSGKWTGGIGGGVSEHHLRFQLPDTSIVDLLVMFEALGERNVEDLFRGKEFNIMRLNESDTLAPEVLSQGIIRVMQGRYPGQNMLRRKSAFGAWQAITTPPILKTTCTSSKRKTAPKAGNFTASLEAWKQAQKIMPTMAGAKPMKNPPESDCPRPPRSGAAHGG